MENRRIKNNFNLIFSYVFIVIIPNLFFLLVNLVPLPSFFVFLVFCLFLYYWPVAILFGSPIFIIVDGTYPKGITGVAITVALYSIPFVYIWFQRYREQ
jgi:hypothetical protein